MDETKKLLPGGGVLLEDGTWARRAVLLEGGRILDLLPEEDAAALDVPRIGCEGLYVAPGLIDTHVHGAMGRNFMEGTPEAVAAISDFLVRGGVTSCLGTTTSARPEDQDRALRGLRAISAAPVRGQVELLGIHLEGPFVNPKNRGAHAEANVRPITGAELRAIADAAGEALKVVTLAPELEGALEAVDFFAGRGVRVSVGHTLADAAQTRAALDRGAARGTHLFNAMPPIHHRAPGPVCALLLCPDAFLELTVDGKHLAPEIVELVVRAAGCPRCVLITDGVDVRGLGDGAFRRWEGTEVLVQNGEARTRAGGLAGSMLTMAEAVKNAVTLARVPLADALRMGAENPARSVGAFDRKGSIAPGKDADLVILRQDLSVAMTLVRGDLVYKGEQL